MIELVLVLILLFIFSFLKIKNGLILLLTLLPFHAFTKRCLEFLYNGGAIFSLWKEAVILILLTKIIYDRRKLILDRNLNGLVFFFVAYIILFFLFAKNHTSAVAPLRDHIFTLLIMIVFSNAAFNITNPSSFLIFPFIAFLLSYLLGFVQLFLLKVPLGFLMGRIEFIDSSGYIQYTTNSARILGIERMAGIIGGPNDFGLFVAISLLLLFIFRFTKLSIYTSNLFKLVLTAGIAIGSFTLLYSFSRAGWAIFLGGILYFIAIYNIKIKQFLLVLPILAILTIFFVSRLDSSISKVYEKTFAGEEASSADRLNEVRRGIFEIFSSPVGHGLGTANNQYPDLVEFFAESAMVNILYEIGAFGYLVLLLIFFYLGRANFRNRKHNPFSALGYVIVVLSFMASIFSINTYGMPYILYSWALIGLGINPYINTEMLNWDKSQ